jgi:hypothetical protein
MSATRTRKKPAAFAPPPAVATAAASLGAGMPATAAEILRGALPNSLTDTYWNSLLEAGDAQSVLRHVAADAAKSMAGAVSALNYLQIFFGSNDRNPGLEFVASSLRNQARLLDAAVRAVHVQFREQEKAEDAAREARAKRREKVS